MAFISPLTKRRLTAFRRNRRAWWSCLALAAVFVFCLAAEVTCPRDPRAVVDPKTLEPYRSPAKVRVYDAREARFSAAADGEVYDFEGPEEIRRAVGARVAGADALSVALGGYHVRAMPRDGYKRVFLEPTEPARAVETELPPQPVAFPFRPCPGHPFGVDAGGRDVYARVVYGLRIALLFGLLLAGSGLVFGVVIGAVEGYFGGVADLTLQRFTEIWSALPFLYVMIFLGSTLGRSFGVLLSPLAIGFEVREGLV